MTQTCVFIKACLGFGSFVFMQHSLLMSMLCTPIQPLLLVVAYFMTLKERLFTKIWLCFFCFFFDLSINYMV